MRNSLTETNISTLIDICLNSDSHYLQKQIKNLCSALYGLDSFVDDQKQNLLHILASNHEFKNWDILLNGFVYLDTADNQFQTPLFIAIQQKNLIAIRALVKNGASAILENQNKMNPILLACEINYEEGFLELMNNFSAKSWINSNFIRVGKLCISRKSLKVFKALVRLVPQDSLNAIDEDKMGLIHYIVLANDLDMLKIFVSLNFDSSSQKVDLNLKMKINKVSKTPIEMAETSEIVSYLYSCGAVVNKKTQNKLILDIISKTGSTGKSFNLCDIHKAAIEGNLSVIKSYNKNLDDVDTFQMTPLLYAISNSQTQAIQLLIDKGANPNFFTGKTTAYLFCALKGNVDAFRILIKKGKPNFKIVDIEERYIISCAILSNNPDMVRAVYELKPPLSGLYETINNLLLKLDEHVASMMVEYFLNDKDYPLKTPIRENKSLLQISIETGKTEIAMKILNTFKGKPINLFEQNPEGCLISAVISDNPDVTKALLEAGVNSNIMNHGKSLLHETIKHKTDKTRKILIEHNPKLSLSVDQMGNSFLNYAAISNSYTNIKLSICELKIPVDFKNYEGTTPIMQLVQNQSDDFQVNFEFLMQNKANIFEVNNKKQNILHLCSKYNNEKALQKLVGSRSESDFILSEEIIKKLMPQQDSDGLTPIEYAAKKNNAKCAEILSFRSHLPIFDSFLTIPKLDEYLNKGFSPNVYNTNGTNLLVYTISQYEKDPQTTIQLIKKLMEYKADPSLINYDQLMPIHHAILVGSKEIVKMLVEKGANFLVEPIISAFARENGKDDILEYVKGPEKRASAINELLSTQLNAVPILGCICNNSQLFGNDPNILLYLEQVNYMHRLLTLFTERFQYVYDNLTLSTELGPFLLYFSDAFLPLIPIAALYEKTITILRKSPTLSQILSLPSGHSKLSFDDALIVPTQQFTYYPELIKAIIKATPNDHPDFKNLTKAQVKFAFIGKSINERKLIAESQKELNQIKMISSICGKTFPFYLDDILLTKGQFELKNYSKPQKVNSSFINDSTNWGIKTLEQKVDTIQINFFEPNNKVLDIFFSKGKIAIYLFRKTILFGIQKNTDKFKLKFSCKTSDVFWDFGRDYYPDSVMLYVPFGQMLLKFAPPKGTQPNFERNRWRSDVEKLNALDESEISSNNGFEQCYTSWVSAQTKCSCSHSFFVYCNDKMEAESKIMKNLKERGIQILSRPNSLGEQKPLINFSFQTIKTDECQGINVISDISN